MEANNQQLFDYQIDEVIQNFPQLKKIAGNDGNFIKGILDIPNDDGKIIGSFMIEIKNRKGFPNRFPILYETGGDILNEADWHKYPNGACCITVQPDELLICRNGITLLQFVRQHAIGYFANHIHRLVTGKYKNGEYAHGSAGNRQFYTNLLKTSDVLKWIKYYEHVFKKKPIRIERNEPCFCGSGQKFKSCHNKVFQDLKWLGEDTVRQQFLQIMKPTI